MRRLLLACVRAALVGMGALSRRRASAPWVHRRQRFFSRKELDWIIMLPARQFVCI